MADGDDAFESLLDEWEDFVGENHLWVLLEQSCDEGVMLAEEAVYLRLKDCPREWLAPLETLLQQCPKYVLAFLAQRHYLAPIIVLARTDQAFLQSHSSLQNMAAHHLQFCETASWVCLQLFAGHGNR